MTAAWPWNTTRILTAAQSCHASLTVEAAIRADRQEKVIRYAGRGCLSGAGFNLVASDTFDLAWVLLPSPAVPVSPSVPHRRVCLFPYENLSPHHLRCRQQVWFSHASQKRACISVRGDDRQGYKACCSFSRQVKRSEDKRYC